LSDTEPKLQLTKCI